MYRQNYPNDPGMHVNENTRVRYHRNPTFFERVGSSLVGVLVGTVLLLSASGLLFWNEGRAVKRARALDEGLTSVHNLHTIDVVLDENNGKLVYVTGELHTDKELSDSMYRVSVSAVKLKREVEMYQWVEHEHRREVDEGSHTREEVTYSYSQEWRPEPIGSSSFYNTVGHHNPGDFPVKTTEYTASEVKVGAFLLSKGLVEKISEYKDIEATVEPTIEGVRLYMGYYYHGSNPLQPQVGDLKVKFLFAGLTKGDNRGISAQPDTVSIIGEQRRGWLEGYQTQAGDSLELLYYGTLTPKEIFGREHAHNTMLSWGVRFGGWLLMFVGFSCITNLIAVLVDWLPIIREMVAMGMHMMSMALSISLSLTVIAIGWIVYRPFLGLTILVMAASPFIISKWRMHQTRSSSNRNV